MKLINKVFACLLLAVISVTGLYAQAFNKTKLDSLFKVLAINNKAMGSITISKNGTVLYSNAVGYSFIGGTVRKPSTPDTRYRVGSISKMFTATMVMQLIEEGKLKLNTPIVKFFPNLPNAKLITVNNLLNHRSGLHNFTSDADYLTWMEKPRTREQLMEIISRNAVDFQPDQKAEYSNSNYVLLGWIIEDITRQSLPTALYERICKRADLTHTYIGGPTDTLLNESFSYKFVRSWERETVTDLSIPGGAGSVVSTTGDLCKFIEALFNGKLVADSNLLRMKTMTDGFGLGMFAYPFNAKKAFGHTGGIDGFSSILTYFPEDSLSVAYCSNGEVFAMNDILIGALSIYYNQPYMLPTFTSIAYKSEDLDKYIGLYSSLQMPLKISITKDSVTLIAQASGQSSFRLEAFEADKFKYEQAGLKMEFNPDRKEMILKQGGGTFLFTKEKN